jgi:DNA-binding response OmpR family regulator
MLTTTNNSGFTPSLEFYEADYYPVGHSQADLEIIKALEVMIVAEDVDFSRAMGAILQEQGYQIYVAPDVQTAVEELDNYNIDLLIVQLSRDSLAGLAAVRQARQGENSAKVMIISGPTGKEFPAEAFEADVDDYLLFPFSTAQLGRRVAALLGPELAARGQIHDQSPAEKINAHALESLHLLMGDIRNTLLQVSASVRGLNHREYGHLSPDGAKKIDEILGHISQAMDLANTFYHRTSPISQINGW